MKTLFFEKIKKIDQPVARQTKKEDKAKMNNIRNKAGDKITYSSDIKKIRKYYDQHYTYKFDR